MCRWVEWQLVHWTTMNVLKSILRGKKSLRCSQCVTSLGGIKLRSSAASKRDSRAVRYPQRASSWYTKAHVTGLSAGSRRPCTFKPPPAGRRPARSCRSVVLPAGAPKTKHQGHLSLKLLNRSYSIKTNTSGISMAG